MVVRVGVIGVGYMGSAHARVVNRISHEYLGEVRLEYIVDVDYDRAKHVSHKYGGKPLSRVEDIPRNGIDLAIIATPTEHHYSVFVKLAGLGVEYYLIEKPVTRSIEEAYRILETCREMGLKVGVGHIERFNPVIKSLLSHIARGFLGDPLTTISRRVGPFVARVRNTDVVYDLGIHEIDISLSIYLKYPVSIRTYTLENIVSHLTDYALLILSYPRGFSSIEVNRVTPFKQRIMYLTGTRGVAFVDYMEQRLVIHTNEHDINVRVRREEPLYLEDKAVIDSVIEGREPPIDIYQAFTSLLLCEKGLESTRASSEIVIEDDRDYQLYRDVVREGISRYKRFVESLKTTHL